MKHIHPMQIVRNVTTRMLNTCNIWLLKYQAKKYGVRLTIGDNVVLRQCALRAVKRNTGNELYIADRSDLRGVSFAYFGKNGCVRIGMGKINAGKEMAVSFKCGTDSQIIVEDGFLFSNSIDLCTTDFHPVYDEYGNRMNPNKDVVIEKDCWIARKAYIGKGVHLPSGSIVGAYAVVTKPFVENNVMIAGNPAIIKKRNIFWKN